ncbi:MAG TPA: response regulator [Spirochaetales bacterium]|nr:response regulator [Spirochaetales bacterium]
MSALVVEDEALTAMELALHLERRGFGEARLASTGEDAVALARAERPEVAIMDQGLGGAMGGAEAGRILSLELGVPVIMLSGCAGAELAPERLGFEPVAALVKPLDDAELDAALDRLARGAHR